MAGIETAILDRLQSSGPLQGLVANRIAPWESLQSTEFPCVTYTRVSTDHIHDLRGGSGFAQANVQIDLWGNTYSQVKDMAEYTRRALDGWNGTLAGHRVSGIFIQSERDMPQRVNTGTEKSLYRVMQEYRISYRETATRNIS